MRLPLRHGALYRRWKEWKKPQAREEKQDIGQLCFCLMQRVTALFTESRLKEENP